MREDLFEAEGDVVIAGGTGYRKNARRTTVKTIHQAVRRV
jgi:hypothetical protein